MELLEVLDDVPWQMPTIEEEDEEPTKEEAKIETNQITTKDGKTEMTIEEEWELYDKIDCEQIMRRVRLIKRQEAQKEKEEKVDLDKTLTEDDFAPKEKTEDLAMDELEFEFSRASCSQPHPWKFTHPL
jgi:hypothetical protein